MIKQVAISSLNKYFEFKKLVGSQGAPELKLLSVAIALFTPTLHETLTNTICQLSHGSSFNCRKLKSISQRNALLTASLIGITF